LQAATVITQRKTAAVKGCLVALNGRKNRIGRASKGISILSLVEPCFYWIVAEEKTVA
jgi:hypothetical protein